MSMDRSEPISIPKELLELSLKYSQPGSLVSTPLEGLSVIRSDSLSGPVHSVYEPSVCYVVQGAKNASVGNKVYRCEPGRFFVCSANLPVVGEVLAASPEAPYVALILSLHSRTVYEIQEELDLQKPTGAADGVAVFTDEVNSSLTEAFLRLMRTLDKEKDRQIVAPLAVKEITYYLMQSPFSRLLHDLGTRGSGLDRISRSLRKIRQDFAKPLKVDALAQLADMSPSAFYEHFKKLTSLSPIQYQKQLRLQEARKLLATEVNDVTSVAYNVGYESPSQFSRDYSRLFGLSPSKDIQNLRNTANATEIR